MATDKALNLGIAFHSQMFSFTPFSFLCNDLLNACLAGSAKLRKDRPVCSTMSQPSSSTVSAVGSARLVVGRSTGEQQVSQVGVASTLLI